MHFYLICYFRLRGMYIQPINKVTDRSPSAGERSILIKREKHTYATHSIAFTEHRPRDMQLLPPKNTRLGPTIIGAFQINLDGGLYRLFFYVASRSGIF